MKNKLCDKLIKIQGVGTLVTVKLLKPYYIRTDAHRIQITLAYQYFSILIKNKVYHFIPVEDKEIIIERKTKKIINIKAKFAFQKDEDIVYFTMAELISLPDFLLQLFLIIESYYTDDKEDPKKGILENDYIIHELERLNVLKLIDDALDNRDKETFDLLVEYL